MKRILKYFEDFSDYYIYNYLAPIDIEKMTKNEKYATKLFFYKWAYERSGAPKAYKITSAKTFHILNDEKPKDIFKEFYSGKKNINGNPIYDNKIKHVRFSKLPIQLKKNKINEAFNQLRLKGVKHKIRSFYLRDIYYLVHPNFKITLNQEDYLYLFPVDIWVRLFAEYLGIEPKPVKTKPVSRFDLNKNDRELGNGLINLCLQHGVSPLKLNMGVWMYCANVISDAKRLEKLLTTRSINELKAEFNMIKDVVIWNKNSK